MINIETALALFDGVDQIQKQQGVDDELWEKEIGPKLRLLEHMDLAWPGYSNEVDYPTSAILTSAGIKRRDQLSNTRKDTTLITAQDQDVLLHYLVENLSPGSPAILEINEQIHGFAGDALYSILHHFSDLGLIDFDGYRTIDRQTVSLLVKVKAHEFIQQGGFYGKFELFQKTVEKLLWEVEKLEREDKNDNNKFTTFKKNIQEYASVLANLATIADSGSKMFE